jgi:hypothetical protein
MTHPGQCIYPPTASQRKAPLFNADGKHPAPANPAGLILRLMNNCPIDLWVHAAGIPNGVVELPPKAAGTPPAEQVFDWPGGNGRLSATQDSATGFNITFLEFTAAKAKALNVNLSNVDWIGLPVEVRGNDPTKCLTACYTPLANMMNGCPPELLDATHHVCQAPKNWCASAANMMNDPLHICTDVVTWAQAVVSNDPKCAAGKAVNANAANLYGCGGAFWSASPYCCAELTRGYATDKNDPGKDMTQNCNYYVDPMKQYSAYSAYSQSICPFVYSFAYDDFNNQSGFTGCNGATEMDVTYCPGDP